MLYEVITPTYADILYQDSQIVGRVVYEPRKFVSKDGSLRAVNPIDVLIDSAYRSPANFPQLMQGIRHHDKSQLVYFSVITSYSIHYTKLYDTFDAILRWRQVRRSDSVVLKN